MQDRVEMCRTLIPLLQDSNIQNNIFVSDNVTFYSNRFVNKHNIRYECEIKPHKITVETAIKLCETKHWVCTLKKPTSRTILL